MRQWKGIMGYWWRCYARPSLEKTLRLFLLYANSVRVLTDQVIENKGDARWVSNLAVLVRISHQTASSNSGPLTFYLHIPVIYNFMVVLLQSDARCRTCCSLVEVSFLGVPIRCVATTKQECFANLPSEDMRFDNLRVIHKR